MEKLPQGTLEKTPPPGEKEDFRITTTADDNVAGRPVGVKPCRNRWGKKGGGKATRKKKRFLLDEHKNTKGFYSGRHSPMGYTLYQQQ